MYNALKWYDNLIANESDITKGNLERTKNRDAAIKLKAF
jgi:hypothetical protein